MSIYEFAPGLALSVQGAGAVVDHFDAEYASARSVAPSGRIAVEVRFGIAPEEAQPTIRGGHKSVRWEVGLSSPDRDPLRAMIRLRGVPHSFALSLVQGYVVEALLALAASRTGRVLLPAAAFSDGDGAHVLMGRSRSGKSSVATLALVAGRSLLGDDQVLIEARRSCRPFPRRLRVYSDLRRTAPAAHAALPVRSRRQLAILGAAEALSRGYIRPPVRVRPDELGRVARSPLPIARVALIDRAGSGPDLSTARLEQGALIEAAAALLDEQRSVLRSASDPAWAEALAEIAESEAAALRRALDGVPVERISLPAAWDAPRAISALAERLGL